VPSTPRSVERCVARCLQKDPERRYQNAADLQAALEDIREDLVAPPTNPPRDEAVALPLRGSRAVRRLIYTVFATAIGAAAFLVGRSLRPSIVPTPDYRPFITEAQTVGVPVWSPDGRTLAYMAEGGGRRQVFLRGLDATESTQVTREGADGISLFWSPDGARIYFTRAADGSLMSVGVGGGEPQLVVNAFTEEASGPTTRLAGGVKACMSPDGRTIVFPRRETGGVRLWRLDVGTRATQALDPAGMPRPLANVQALAFSPDGASLAVIASTTALNDARGVWLMSWPRGAARHLFADAPFRASNPSVSWLPDSRRFVMNGYPIHGGTSRLLLADVGEGTLSALTGGKDDEVSPSVTSDGRRIAFVSRRSGLDLIRVRLDSGPPEPLLATSRTESRPDMSASGLLAYVTDAAGGREVRVRTDINAWSRAVRGNSGPEQDEAMPFAVRVSPDDQRVAVEAYGAEHLIWIYPIAGGPPVRLDVETTDQHGPSWSPDGNWIAYRRLRNGTWEIVKAPVGGGAVQRLDDADPGGAPTDWSRTGQWIAHGRPDGMHLVSPDGTATRVLTGLRSAAFHFSRDGSQLMAVTRGANRQWELTIWNVEAARQVRVVALPLPSTADVQGMALSPDDSYVVLAAGTPTSDIWLLEQFEPPSAPLVRWLRR
jgi:Tol biopolymer transport system component